jgi:hypothetical protein
VEVRMVLELAALGRQETGKAREVGAEAGLRFGEVFEGR